MKLNRIDCLVIYSLILLSSLAPSVLARELIHHSVKLKTSTQDGPFVLRSSAKGDEFSILVPARTTSFLQPMMPVYSAYANGVVYFVVVYEAPEKGMLKHTLMNARQYFRSSEIPVTVDGFNGQQFSKTEEGVYYKTQYFATKHKIYVISIAARDEGNPAINSFFSSLKLGRAVSTTDTDAEGASTPASTKNQTPLPDLSDTGPVLEQGEVTRKAVFVWQPYLLHLMNSDIAPSPRGKIKLEMVLRSSGQVTDVRVIKGLSQYVNQKIIERVKYSRFLPAEKDGRPVSVRITFEFNYS